MASPLGSLEVWDPKRSSPRASGSTISTNRYMRNSGSLKDCQVGSKSLGEIEFLQFFCFFFQLTMANPEILQVSDTVRNISIGLEYPAQ